MKPTSKSFRYVIARKLYHLVLKLDNSGNCNFDSNGEKKFLNELFEDLRHKENIILFDIGGNMGDYTQMLFDNVKNLTDNYCFVSASTLGQSIYIHYSQFDSSIWVQVVSNSRISFNLAFAVRVPVGINAKLLYKETL